MTDLDRHLFFHLLGDITPGLPSPQLPPFSTVVGNTTYTGGEMLSHLGSGLLVLPLVGIISNVAIAKAFCEYYFNFLFRAVFSD